MQTWRERLVQLGPRGVAGVGLLIMVAFAGARLLLAADRDVSSFVVAGTEFTEQADPPPLRIFAGAGYDGQFYWRLAVDPSELGAQAAHGVRLDQPLRASRIGYPVVAWLLSGGQESAVRWSLLAVNLAAMSVAAFAAARLAEASRQPAVVGLIVVAATGLVMSVARDLTEVMMIAAVLVGVERLQRRALTAAALAWSVAVLTHEQALVVVGSYLLACSARAVAERRLEWRRFVPAVVPLAVFCAWEVVARQAVGQFPVFSSRDASVSWPVLDLARAIGRWISGDIARQEVLVLPQLAVAAWLMVTAWQRRRRLAADDRWLVVALVAASALALSLSDNVWVGPAELRQAVLVPVLSATVIVVSGEPPGRWLASAVGAIWLLTAGLRVVAV